MVDFAALPPEVNSGRMYLGAGAGPLTTAATAWDRLAVELSGAANSFRAAVSELTNESWAGPAAAAMAAAVAPYVEWMDTTAAQAAQTGHRARAAVAAYETAFAAMVPPAAIAANRASLTHLVATNIFGLNAHAIAANQAQYTEMWSQDVAAMQDYQARSAAAAAVTPFTAAPQDTNPAGAQPAQGSTWIERLGAYLSSLGTTGIWKYINDFWISTPMQYVGELALLATGFVASQGGTGFQTAGISLITAVPENAALAFFIWYLASQNAMSELGLAGAGSAAGGLGGVAGLGGLSSAPAALASSGSALAGSGGPGAQAATAGLGRSAAVGGLSVPQSWGSATRDVRLAATALPTAAPAAVSQAGAMGAGNPGGMLGGIPPVASALNASKTGDSGSRYANRPKVVAHLPGETGVRHDKSERAALDAASVLNERNELDKLRKEILDLAKERDVLARSAQKLIKQAAEL